MSDYFAGELVETAATEPLWQVAHRQLVLLARARAGIDLEEARWLVAAHRAQSHVRLGLGSFVEYIERVFGYSPRLTQEKLRVAEALEVLPRLARGLEQGEVSWSAARELTRVMTPETEQLWLDATRGKTVREIERLVSGHHRGDEPGDGVDEGAKRHVVRFEVSGEVLATLRDAFAKIRRDADGSLDDDTALLLMARQVLGGPVDEGRASYQVAVSVCDQCQRVWQQGRGEQVRVEPQVAAMMACDAQQVTAAPPGNGPVDAHVGSSPRAVQEVPPSIRRAVLRRDQGRCRFPGCRHATFVDVQHIELRSENGRHEPDNLVILCAAHHRAVHRGTIGVSGSASVGLEFRHADGSAYGALGAPADIDVRARTFRALRALGFGERDARRALADAHVGVSADVAAVVRDCLRALSQHALARAS